VLVIRDEQLRILGLERERSLESHLIQRFAREYPEDYSLLNENRALDFVRETIRSAAQRKITSEDSISGLLKLYIEFGRELELAPYRHWANSILDHHKLPGGMKVNLVSTRLFGLTQGRRIILHREEG
jgi:hypothetical protein